MIDPSPAGAKQSAPVTPFQGFSPDSLPIPRALPWAALFGPFGAVSLSSVDLPGQQSPADAGRVEPSFVLFTYFLGRGLPSFQIFLDLAAMAEEICQGRVDINQVQGW